MCYMDNSIKSSTISRKDFRKLLKKMQRKKRRQKTAKELTNQLKIEEKERLEDPQHQQWLKEQNDLEQKEKLQQEADEQAWLQREKLAQQQFQRDQQRLKEVEAAQEKLKLKQQEYMEKLKQKQNEEKRVEIKTVNEFEHIMQRMEEYLTNTTAQAPSELRTFVETKPYQQLCAFYERTNCCRYGLLCQFNHRRPMLSTILLIRNFYTHPLLKPSHHTEYECGDPALELNERDLREDYDAFFEDVTTEMQHFGKILNFRTVRNLQTHLCGNVYVEYQQERFLTNEGLSVRRKCPKGNACNYLHLLQNPDNKYNTLLEYTKLGLAKIKSTTTTESVDVTGTTWDDDYVKSHNGKSRYWRWSESPEPHDIKEKITDNKIVHLTTDLHERNSKMKDAELKCNIKDIHEKKDSKVQHLSSHRKRSRSRDIRAKEHSRNHSIDNSHKNPKVKHQKNKKEKF